jgi:hypothetical protein
MTQDTIRDRWEESVALAVPPIAFGGTEVGAGFRYGVILPCPVEGPFHNRPYEEVFDMEPRRIIAKEGPEAGKEIDNPLFGQPRRWPPRGQQTVGQAKQITVFTLAIAGLEVEGVKGDHFDGVQLMSKNAVENFTSASKAGIPEDLAFLTKVKEWGLRRLFDTGGSLQPQLDAAIRAATRKPSVGSIVSVHVKEKEPRGIAGFTRIFAVEYLAPTRASLALVDLYMKSPVFIEKRKADKAESQSDAWGAQQHDDTPGPASAPASAPVPPAPSTDDEPPF